VAQRAAAEAAEKLKDTVLQQGQRMELAGG